MKYLIVAFVAFVALEFLGVSTVDLVKSYGWRILAGVVVTLALYSHYAKQLSEWWSRWEDSRLQAYYKKNPDAAAAAAERVRRARELQQDRWLRESQRDREAREERERERAEQKRLEREELIARLGPDHAGSSSSSRSAARAEYLPLSGGGGGGYQRPARRPACPGGGCGR